MLFFAQSPPLRKTLVSAGNADSSIEAKFSSSARWSAAYCLGSRAATPNLTHSCCSKSSDMDACFQNRSRSNGRHSRMPLSGTQGWCGFPTEAFGNDDLCVPRGILAVRQRSPDPSHSAFPHRIKTAGLWPSVRFVLFNCQSCFDQMIQPSVRIPQMLGSDIHPVQHGEEEVIHRRISGEPQVLSRFPSPGPIAPHQPREDL